MDVAAKGQLAAVRVEAGARAAALAPPPPPDAQNAAPVYRKAFAALAPPDQLPAALRGDDRPAFDPTDPGLREFLDAQQRGLALLRQAAALPQAGFDRDLGDDSAPLDVPVPELPLLQHGATLLAADARARAARGDSRGAIDDVAAVFGIARHVRFPLLIDLLTAAVIERVGAAALEDVLAAAPAKADDLGRLKLSPGDPFQPYLRRVFAMEEAWGMAAIAMIATGRADGSPEVREQTGLGPWGEAPFALAMYRVFFLEEDLAAYRRHLRTMREHAARPAPQMLDGFAEHERQIKSNRGGGILAGLLLPAAYRLMFAALDADAVHALARTAVAAAAYKAKHGKHPERLGELVPEFLPEVPADPYDGRPVRLRRADGGLVFYSLGRDRKDDAGRPWDADRQEGDLVFRLR
jgi:hypothetical protein